MDLNLWFYRLVSTPGNGLAFLLYISNKLGSHCRAIVQHEMLLTLLGFTHLKKIEQSYMYERTVLQSVKLSWF